MNSQMLPSLTSLWMFLPAWIYCIFYHSPSQLLAIWLEAKEPLRAHQQINHTTCILINAFLFPFAHTHLHTSHFCMDLCVLFNVCPDSSITETECRLRCALLLEHAWLNRLWHFPTDTALSFSCLLLLWHGPFMYTRQMSLVSACLVKQRKSGIKKMRGMNATHVSFSLALNIVISVF